MPQTTNHCLKYEQLGRPVVPFERLNAGVSANDHLAFREAQRVKAMRMPAPEAALYGARCGGLTRLLFADTSQDIAQIFRKRPTALAVSGSPSATLKMDKAALCVGAFSAVQTLKVDPSIVLPSQKRVVHAVSRSAVRSQMEAVRSVLGPRISVARVSHRPRSPCAA
ncbi:hypothetical protein [uncultured Brevundimonas sp.]|uniref:hypothetical protein n=1 Tax=uncultured Brevundimonas sp. TaxID=213418 RepID=UPI0025EB5631|nr:hypothetical protein [uncultured Brevundimonas sp.]